MKEREREERPAIINQFIQQQQYLITYIYNIIYIYCILIKTREDLFSSPYIFCKHVKMPYCIHIFREPYLFLKHKFYNNLSVKNDLTS